MFATVAEILGVRATMLVAFATTLVAVSSPVPPSIALRKMADHAPLASQGYSNHNCSFSQQELYVYDSAGKEIFADLGQQFVSQYCPAEFGRLASYHY